MSFIIDDCNSLVDARGKPHALSKYVSTNPTEEPPHDGKSIFKNKITLISEW